MSTSHVVFIDSRVSGYETLVASLSADTEWYLLDANLDGVDQMQRLLADYTHLDSVQVISHGSAGALYLGNTVLNGDNLATYQTQLQAIGAALTETGDILLYGCNVAHGDVGLSFVNALAQITEADVAASTDASGSAALGGDSVLEIATGAVAGRALDLEGLSGVLAVNGAPTFPLGDGIVTTAIGGFDYGRSVTVQTDGKILVAGESLNGGNTDFALVRYNTDGTLDTSFSGDGKLTTAIGTGMDRGYSVTVQADGKILVAGESSNGRNTDFALVRYNTDGSLDTSFSGEGWLTTAIGTGTDSGQSVTVQADGKILVAGFSDNGGNTDFALVRYNTDGSLDTSFSGEGWLTTAMGLYDDSGYSVAVQADGKILVAGESSNGGNTDFALVRYNTDGSLDTSFSGDGKLTTAIGTGTDSGQSVTVQADGKILVAGFSDNGGNTDFALVRYNTDGSLDTSFSGDGKLITAIGRGADSGQSVTVQADGKILVAGFSHNGGNTDFALVRYSTDGSLDTSFSGDGKLTTSMGLYYDSGYSVAVQADGKILVAGNSSFYFGLVRYNTDGSLDNTFDNFLSVTSNSLDGVASYIENGVAVILDGDVQIYDPELSALNNYRGATLTLARHSGASSEDVYSGAGIAPGQESGNIKVSKTVIGSYTYAAGTLTLTFNSIAPQSLVNQALQSLAYSNSSDAPPASVQINWTFNDGNTGAQGTGGALSVTGNSTVNITPVNDAPTGRVTISGTAAEGQTLTASHTLADADGLGTVSYQWLADGSAISGATDATLVLDQAQVGQTIAVQASYTDGQGTAESVTSAATSAVANVNDAPTGRVTISGTAAEGQTLTASHTLADADGLGTVSYQWLADGSAISGATDATLVLDQAQVGQTIAVQASYTDGQGTAESVTSAATSAVANVNDAPTGRVTISGTAAEGQTLTASHTLADADGLGTVSYQWLADGSAISGATDATLVLDQAQVGQTIAVQASYTDGQGTAESVTSAATSAVANVNDAPTGRVTISGTAAEGQTLTASHTLADADGLGTVSYQWLADGSAISGATDATLVLDQAQVGRAISVQASYTDGQGTAESVTSAATSAVANVNDAPTGRVTISGTAAEGQTLTASHTLADADGLGTVSYQWLADGSAISGATDATLVLDQAQVGQTIAVQASYTDGQGTAESVTSAATSAVANVNDAPTGRVTISGTAAEGQTLTASHTLADADGLGTVSYQWLADGSAISGATDATLVLDQAQVGQTIAVQASYTDGQGTAESVTSAATSAVANVNDAPTGRVTISGTAAEGQTLTASHTLADADGLGTVSYQWLADGSAISGATDATLVLDQAQVGRAISVQASYTDGQGTAESVTSAATSAVANVNVVNVPNSAKYFVTDSRGSYFEWSADLGDFSVLGKSIQLTGGAGDDALYVQAGTSADFTNVGGGTNTLYLTGNLSDYTQTIDQETGVYSLTRHTGLSSGQTESVQFTVSDKNDILYFADGHLTINAESDARLYDGAEFKQLQFDWLVTGGTPATPIINAPTEATNPAKIFVTDPTGLDIPKLPQPGQAMAVTGSGGVDRIYVNAGTSVDATNLGGGDDAIYLMGKLADYRQSIDQETGVYTLTRTIDGKIETVKFTVSDQNDVIYFADGRLVINAETDSRLYDGATFKDLQTAWLTGEGTPLPNTDATAPTVTTFGSTTADGTYGVGAPITLTATLSETVRAGSSLEITLDTGDKVTLSTAQVGTTLSGTYTVGAGDNSADLTVRSFTANVTDVAGNAMSSTTLPLGQNLADTATLVIDTTAPTATLSRGSYNNGTLTLTGTNFDTLGVSTGSDVKAQLDWSKLVWDINGDGSTTANAGFTLNDISSAVLTNTTTLSITFIDTARATLEGLTGFGNDGGADTLEISAGFLKDRAGNAATGDALAAGALTFNQGATLISESLTEDTSGYDSRYSNINDVLSLPEAKIGLITADAPVDAYLHIAAGERSKSDYDTFKLQFDESSDYRIVVTPEDPSVFQGSKTIYLWKEDGSYDELIMNSPDFVGGALYSDVFSAEAGENKYISVSMSWRSDDYNAVAAGPAPFSNVSLTSSTS
jgi:uncharacterized delta-60 repeat protein